MLNQLETCTKVRWYYEKQNSRVSSKSDDVSTNDVTLKNDVKNMLTSSVIIAPTPLLICFFVKFIVIQFQRGVNHFHTTTRNKIIGILKMSVFYDVTVKIWRHDDVTSDFFYVIRKFIRHLTFLPSFNLLARWNIESRILSNQKKKEN